MRDYSFAKRNAITSDDDAEAVFQGDIAIRESDTLMAILEEGEQKGLAKGQLRTIKAIILRFGTDRFGAFDPTIYKHLAHIKDQARLNEMVRKLPKVAS